MMTNNPRLAMIGRLLKWAMQLAALVLGLTIGAVLYYSEVNLRHYGEGRGLTSPVDAILVLGGGVDGDGVLGYSSRRRVALAVALLKAGKARNLIFSGGPGSKHPDLTAAALMREYALELGASPERLLTEGHAISTFENLRFGFELAEKQGFADSALLTDAYHLERARWLARYFGHPEVGLVAARGLEQAGAPDRVWSIVREALAWWLNLAETGMDVDARQELIR